MSVNKRWKLNVGFWVSNKSRNIRCRLDIQFLERCPYTFPHGYSYRDRHEICIFQFRSQHGGANAKDLTTLPIYGFPPGQYFEEETKLAWSKALRKWLRNFVFHL